jgi:hypothetical protein
MKYELRLYGFRSEILHGAFIIIRKVLFLPLQPAETNMVVTEMLVTSHIIYPSPAYDLDIMAVHDLPSVISIEEWIKT